MINKNQAAARLMTDFEAACNNYLRAFCDKHGHDYEEAQWIGGDVGGVAEVCDYCIGVSTIRTDIDQNAPEEEFIEWYDYCQRIGMLSPDISTPNFDSWLRGCPRHNEDWFTQIEECHRRVEQAERLLKEQLDNSEF